ALPCELIGRNIYILPTRVGWYYLALIAIILLGASHYSNSLGLAVGFLLMALGLVAMLHTQRNLLRLQIRQVHAAPVFAGNQACLAIELVNNTRLDRYAIRVAGENAQAQTLAIAAGARQQAQLHLPTRQRG